MVIPDMTEVVDGEVRVHVLSHPTNFIRGIVLGEVGIWVCRHQVSETVICLQ